jgi:adenylate kinase
LWDVLAALSGTPGTGKSSIAGHLRRKGMATCSLANLVTTSGARTAYDPRRKAWSVNLEVLAEAIPPVRPLVLVGHYAHRLDVDFTVVLRCHPEILRRRLESRGWSPDKVGENVEAEAIGVITSEAMERAETFEVDTTSMTPAKTARAVMEILEGGGDRYRVGKVDWSEVILSWY